MGKPSLKSYKIVIDCGQGKAWVAPEPIELNYCATSAQQKYTSPTNVKSLATNVTNKFSTSCPNQPTLQDGKNTSHQKKEWNKKEPINGSKTLYAPPVSLVASRVENKDRCEDFPQNSKKQTKKKKTDHRLSFPIMTGGNHSSDPPLQVSTEMRKDLLHSSFDKRYAKSKWGEMRRVGSTQRLNLNEVYFH